LCHYNQFTYKIWEGFEFSFSSPESDSSSYLESPPYGILKGGFYGSKEESQEESQKEKEVKFWMWSCGSELSPP
jgi:hypothetical protein